MSGFLSRLVYRQPDRHTPGCQMDVLVEDICRAHHVFSIATRSGRGHVAMRSIDILLNQKNPDLRIRMQANHC